MRVERGARAIGVLVAVVVAASAAACSGGGDDKASSDTAGAPTTFGGDPNRVCNIVSKAEVEAAIGAPVGNGQGASGTACRYDLAGGAEDQAVLVLLTDDPKNPEIFERTRTAAPGAEAVSGVGDKAYVRATGQGVQAFVLKGTAIAVVVVNLPRPAPALTEAAKKLAQGAAGRI